MTIRLKILLACAPLALASPALAQQPELAGRAVVMSKCFQCHTDAMWRDHRQDRRGWEATSTAWSAAAGSGPRRRSS